MLLGMFAQSAQQRRENQMIQSCMVAKGYSLTTTNSPLLTNSQQTQAQQNDADHKYFEEIEVDAEMGDATAQYNLGYCYENGKGAAMDYVEAVKWYRKAAEQGDSYAQYSLGCDYSNGTGVLKDYVEGYKWMLLASANGSQNAAKSIPMFENRMTPEQIDEGQTLARQFAADFDNASKKAASDLIGHWESASLIGNGIGEGVEKMEFDFLPDNQVAITTIQNGNTYTENGQYTVKGDELVCSESNTPPDIAIYSLTGDNLKITYKGGEILLQRVQKNTH